MTFQVIVSEVNNFLSYAAIHDWMKV